MSKKKHASAHAVSQACHFIGQILWINPTSILQLSENEAIRMIGGISGIAISVLLIAKKKQWW